MAEEIKSDNIAGFATDQIEKRKVFDILTKNKRDIDKLLGIPIVFYVSSLGELELATGSSYITESDLSVLRLRHGVYEVTHNFREFSELLVTPHGDGGNNQQRFAMIDADYQNKKFLVRVFRLFSGSATPVDAAFTAALFQNNGSR